MLWQQNLSAQFIPVSLTVLGLKHKEGCDSQQ
jgi:hypothetical protein